MDRFGHAVGAVYKVLIAEGSHFDGLVIDTAVGLRFVDAPEVRRVGREEVELGITRADAEHPGPKGPPGPADIHSTRRDRIDAEDEDRAAAIAQLKIAFIDDLLDVNSLEQRVESVHRARYLAELDRVLEDVI